MADSTRHCKNRRMSVNVEENLKEHLEIEASGIYINYMTHIQQNCISK